MITLRGSKIAWVNNANSLVFSLTAGWTTAAPVAGDRVYIMVGHGFAVSNLAGWTVDDNQAGSNVNGAVFEKVVDAADILAGTVTINFGGVYYGIVAAVALQGAAMSTMLVLSQFQRTASGAGPRTLNSPPGLKTNDYIIHFGMMRLNGTITASRGVSLETVSNTNASGRLTDETLGADGLISNTFTYGGTPTGDYAIRIVVREDSANPELDVFQFERMAVIAGDSIEVAGLARLSVVADDDIAVAQVVRMVVMSLDEAPITGHHSMSLM